ncbi:hypothetical protein [Inquilinus sp. CAU 1745]|uniref:hypothetical protein n=1 Tax=Inquilinus sp. CAU 1745 TaxID=3140369 RepID=UPI00325A81C9
MTITQGLALAFLAYLLLLGRSAWKQGELPQYFRSLSIVALLVGLLAGAVWFYLWI